MPDVLVNLALSVGFFAAVGVIVAVAMRRCSTSAPGRQFEPRDYDGTLFGDEPSA